MNPERLAEIKAKLVTGEQMSSRHNCMCSDCVKTWAKHMVPELLGEIERLQRIQDRCGCDTHHPTLVDAGEDSDWEESPEPHGSDETTITIGGKTKVVPDTIESVILQHDLLERRVAELEAILQDRDQAAEVDRSAEAWSSDGMAAPSLVTPSEPVQATELEHYRRASGSEPFDLEAALTKATEIPRYGVIIQSDFGCAAFEPKEAE